MTQPNNPAGGNTADAVNGRIETLTPGSKKLHAEATRLTPGGLHHNARYHQPYPLFFAKAHGARITDVDGREYLDLWMGGHVAVIDLSGKITIGEGDVVLREKVGELLDADNKHILLNLKNVSYMDSAGIGELVACYKRAMEKEGVVKLLNPSGKVYDLLQLTKLEEVFETYRDEKEALVSF